MELHMAQLEWAIDGAHKSGDLDRLSSLIVEFNTLYGLATSVQIAQYEQLVGTY